MAKAKKSSAKKPAAKKPAPQPAKNAPLEAQARAATGSAKAAAFEDRLVAVSRLYPSPLNPRAQKHDAATIAALADSIVAQGVLQSLLVRPALGKTKDDFEIIAGEGRWRGAAKALMDGRLGADYFLPCRVRLACSDAELVELAATENMARTDMHPLDVAAAITAMRKYYKEDRIIWTRLGVKERTFYRYAPLVRLAEPVKEALRKGKLLLPQAAAFSLGTVAAQEKHLADAAKSGQERYHLTPDAIRREMTAHRIASGDAEFPLKDYTGEFLIEPETGRRFFLDTKQFYERQEAAIKAKVAALKDVWEWVKEISASDGWQYGKAPKGTTGGAVWWKDGRKLHVKTGLAKPGAGAAARDRGRAQHDAEHELQLAAQAKLQGATFVNLAAHPERVLAFVILERVTVSGSWDEHAMALAARAFREAANLAPNVKLDYQVLRKLGDRAPEILRDLCARPISDLLRLVGAIVGAEIATDSAVIDYHDGLTPLGMVLQHLELPFESATAADERAIAGKFGEALAGAEAAP